MLLHDYLHYQARESPDRAFAIQGDRQMTYSEAVEASIPCGACWQWSRPGSW